MSSKSLSDGVVLHSLADDIREYNWFKFRHDLSAGMTVALLAIPQAMAYALVANLPPAAGIFAAIFGAIFAGAFGSSRHLVVGPTNALAVLIQAGTADILFSYYQDLSPLERNVVAEFFEARGIITRLELHGTKLVLEAKSHATRGINDIDLECRGSLRI